MDWDEDGKKDLILGERNGFVRIYLNTNTDADPVFTGYTNLQVGGSTFDIGYNSTPYICDWNNDGKKDVVVGSDAGGIALLINTGTNAAPVFASSVWIQDNGVNIDLTRNCPVVTDWDLDGKKDLIVGDIDGVMHFFSNVNTDASPAFNGYEDLESTSGTIDIGQYSRMEVCDWNNDGHADILCGFHGYAQSGVYLFEGHDHCIPDAKINGSDGPLSVPKSANLTFTVKMTPRSQDGVPVDWWIHINKDGNNTWWAQYRPGQPPKWTLSATPIRFAGAGLRTVNNYKVLGPRTLPKGDYVYTFAVDVKDGTYQGTYIDTVDLNVF